MESQHQASPVVHPESFALGPSRTPSVTPVQEQTEPNRPERVQIWDVPFDRVDMAGAVGHISKLIKRGVPSYVITANLNYVMLHQQQADIPGITENASLILADGQPIVWRSKIEKNPLPCRVAGSEMIVHLAKRCAAESWPVYFLGGIQGVAQAAADELARQYPDLPIAGVESPPFRELSTDERAEQALRIRSSGAKLLLVAFGQPKGERWIAQNYQQLGVPVSIQLGASFDFLAGTAHRAPELVQKLGLEWAHRALSDPRRLVPRYSANAGFMLKALVKDWQDKVTSWGMNPLSNRTH
ncbi:MAG: WecB/TagA/CpsF family glycosyltransferase [Planctomycetota bacterium]